MDERDHVAEDHYQCHYCTDFAYISVILCKVHNFHYCIYHQIMCGCSQENIKLIYRYSTKELDEMEKTLAESCSNTRLVEKKEQQAKGATNFTSAIPAH
jgi:hypothetical protein